MFESQAIVGCFAPEGTSRIDVTWAEQQSREAELKQRAASVLAEIQRDAEENPLRRAGIHRRHPGDV